MAQFLLLTLILFAPPGVPLALGYALTKPKIDDPQTRQPATLVKRLPRILVTAALLALVWLVVVTALFPGPPYPRESSEFGRWAVTGMALTWITFVVMVPVGHGVRNRVPWYQAAVWWMLSAVLCTTLLLIATTRISP